MPKLKKESQVKKVDIEKVLEVLGRQDKGRFTGWNIALIVLFTALISVLVVFFLLRKRRQLKEWWGDRKE